MDKWTPIKFPVQKPGRWRYQTMTVPGGKGQTYAKWSCSVCKAKFKNRTRYCPSCGTYMEGFDD